MDDLEFDELVRTLQGDVHADTQAAFSAKGFERWQHPKFCGVMEDAHSKAKLTGTCGDTMTMYLKIENERVAQASFTTDGCGSSVIAGSFAAELVTGKMLEEVLDMTSADVLREIGKFPAAEEHCAHLAIRTAQEALNRYLMERVSTKKAAH